MGGDLYRLEESPLCEDEVFYKDIFEAARQRYGSLLFQKVVKQSGRKNYDYLLPRRIFESAEFERLLERIDQDGGYWTQAFGGILVVSLPADADFDLHGEVNRLCEKR